MTTWAIIPVKPLHDSKRRLSHLLLADERAELILTFLDNLLLTLNATPGIDRILVVSGDPLVTTLAEKYGALVLIEPAPTGLNAAVARGMAEVAEQGASAVLVLPADLPFVRVEDVEAILRPLTAGRRPLLALCGDEVDEGTNALLLAPPGDFTFCYGPGSYGAHLAEAVERGRATYTVDASGLRFDLDTENDWWTYSGLPVVEGR